MNIPPFEVLVNGLQAGLAIVGERFKRQEAFIPEVLITARALKAGVDLLKPCWVPADAKPMGVCVLGTVKGDLHDIGQNLVSIMLEGAGFEVYNCGLNVTPETFLEKVEELEADLKGMSALLATTMMNQKMTINWFERSAVREQRPHHEWRRAGHRRIRRGDRSRRLLRRTRWLPWRSQRP